MDFELGDDQIALREGARELLDSAASATAVRAIFDGAGGTDAHLWSAMVEQGWPALAHPESKGGLGLGIVEVAVLLEEIGRHAAPAPFASTVLALDALEHGDEPESIRSRELVEKVISGQSTVCVAWSRNHVAVSATAVNGDWKLTGRPDPILDAPGASFALVVADSADGPSLFGVDLAVGQIKSEPAMDRTRSFGWLHLNKTSAWLIGGAKSVNRLLDLGAVFSSAEMLGGAERVLEFSVEYAKDRVQFGRPIGSFQAVKHRCADMLVDVEGMRSSVYWAAWCLSADDPESSVAASTAKVWGADASKRVMASALQVHGGIGFTWEHDLHFYMKRAQVDQLSFGDASYHRERLAQLLRTRVESGEQLI
jgi:alkylation response protein AidB-like acyl-CoA dehydrogenase